MHRWFGSRNCHRSFPGSFLKADLMPTAFENTRIEEAKYERECLCAISSRTIISSRICFSDRSLILAVADFSHGPRVGLNVNHPLRTTRVPSIEVRRDVMTQLHVLDIFDCEILNEIVSIIFGSRSYLSFDSSSSLSSLDTAPSWSYANDSVGICQLISTSPSGFPRRALQQLD